MYKLLLVSDRKEILDIYQQIPNWERIGFKPPHIRHDFEGMRQSLSIHHADGVGFTVDPEEGEKIIEFLEKEYPYLPLFYPGHTTEEALRSLNELKAVLNRLYADFSSDRSDVPEVMLEYRHDLFRRLVSGKINDEEYLNRQMRLLRSRMDVHRPCMLIEMTQPADEESLLDCRWQGSYQMMERTLFTSFSRDIHGYHVLPLITEEGKIYILAGSLHVRQPGDEDESITTTIQNCVEEGIHHAREFFGVNLTMKNIQVLSSLNALCGKKS